MTSRSARGRGRGRGGGGGGRPPPGHCNEYKLTGKCEKRSSGQLCPHRHDLIARKTYSECLEVPEGLSTGNVVGRGGCNVKKLYTITKSCHIKVQMGTALIITNEQGKLPLLVEKMQQIFSQESFYAASQCFINPRRTTSFNCYQFRALDGPDQSTTMYEIHGAIKEQQEDMGDVTDMLGAVSTSDEACADPCSQQKKKKKVETVSKGATALWQPVLHLNTKEDVKDVLSRSLQMLFHERRERKFMIELSARFGKLRWSLLKSDVCQKQYSLENLVELLSKSSSMGRKSFNPNVKSASGHQLRSSLREGDSHAIEVFEVKGDFISSARGAEGGARLDIHLVLDRRFRGETNVQVAMVRKNEAREICFDVLNFERQCDVRVGLYNYEYVTEVDPLHAVVREMVGTLSFPARNLKIQPKMARWSIHSARYKRKTSFLLDDRYAVTVTSMSEHTFDVEKGQAVVLDLGVGRHTQVELRNLAWQCAFGHDAGHSSNQALSRLIERGSVNTRQFDLIPRPWQVENIVRDFDTFWNHLDSIADKLDGLQE